MNTSGEAADQIVRMSLEVGEAALKISGTGAKQLAVLLYAVLHEQKKTRGRARMETLVRSGRPLTVFSVKEGDLKKFVQEAKRYGILYCAVRGPKRDSDGMVDIMVKEEDAPRINRIVERFQFASVSEAAQIKTEIEKSREEKTEGRKRSGKNAQPEETKEKAAGSQTGQAEPEQDRPGKDREDALVDELLGAPEKKEGERVNPSLAKDKPFFQKARKSPLSEPISGRQNRTARGTSKPYQPAMPEKPSVREQIKEIRASSDSITGEKEADTKKRAEPSRDGGAKKQRQTQHKQPQTKRKHKKSKER